MRNGDYIPSRYEAQQDAANLIVGAKTQSNPQSTIGICSSATVQLSPTDSLGDILTAIHDIRLEPTDTFDVCTAVAVASLALKHRQNKNGAQRIVVFIGTPIIAEEKALVKTGKMLKKNNVGIDMILFGNENDTEMLSKLVEAASGNLITIPVGVLASDVLVSSPVLDDLGGTAVAAAAEFGGVDPNMDPELAMALRVSMEEERARQERANSTTAAADAAAPTEDVSDEDAMLQQALAMSMNENEPNEETAVKKEEETEMVVDDTAAAMDEDAAMQMALQMSMQGDATAEGGFQDPAFVQGMLDDMKQDDDDNEDATKEDDDDKKE